ncbi:MAG: PilZ domain-containing protein [Acidobacteria bacterium]|nr:PilZ domain-containing protein [Acidobacteriota bacterium]
MSTPEQSSSQNLTSEIKTIAVLGAGTMGHGIAQVAAAAGYGVILRDISEEVLRAGIRAVELNLAKGVERGKVTEEERDRTILRIYGVTSLKETRGAELFIEAVPERLELKRQMLREVEAVAAGPFVFATNTSSLSITEIAAEAAHPERVVGMHFFNPVHLMRLLEIVVGEQTSDATVEVAREVGRRMRKEPITVRDVPGFASSRLGVAIGLEAMRMVEEGVASAKDIDTAMELGYNHPMGPLRLTDLVGLDVRLHIADYLHGKLGTERFRPPEILRRMVEEGKLGNETDDISTSGTLFHLNQRVSRGDQLYLRAHRPDGSPIEVTARVVRIAPAIYGTARVGVSILEPADNWLRLFVSWVADEQGSSTPEGEQS